MRHILNLAPKNIGLIRALRWCQWKELGLSDSLIQHFYRTFLGKGLNCNEDFWLTVAQWFSNHWTGSNAQIEPLLDYIRFTKERNDTYSIKGRSTSSLIRAQKKWHRELGGAKNIKWERFSVSGYDSFDYTDEETEKRWFVTELLDSFTLHHEGRELGHCVYSYAYYVRSGHTSIWSLTVLGSKGHKKRLTIEIHNIQKRIAQVRGKSNRLAQKEERKIIRLWAKENKLTMDFT